MKSVFYFLAILLFVGYVSAEPIRLYNINVTISDSWKVDINNNITVFTYDIYNNLTDIESVFISSSDINLSETLMSNSGVGIYVFNFKPANESGNVTFVINAKDQLKSVNQNVTVNIEQNSIWDNFLSGSDEFVDKFKGNLVVWFCGTIIVLLSVASLILLVEILKKK